MDKLRISVYMECGHDKDGNRLVSYIRDELADVKLGILDKEEDIYIEISEIAEDGITVNADGTKLRVNYGESVEFDRWTGCFDCVSSDDQYFFVISLADDDISNYESTKLDLKKNYIKNKEKAQ